MQDRVRVLSVITRLGVSGASSQCILTAGNLNSYGFESMIACGVEGEYEGNMFDKAHQMGIEPLVIPQLRREISIFRDLIAAIKLCKTVRKYRPHIVHTHTSKAGVLGRVAAWLAGVPVVVFTLHGPYFHGHHSPLKTKLFTWLDRILALVTDRIIAVSKSEREELLHHKIGNDHKVVNIPLGLELDDLFTCEQYRGKLRTELGIDGKKFIGIVARLSPIKGHRFFLESAKIVLRHHSDALFLIVGDGELRQEIEEYARSLGISDKVMFLGFRRDLPVVYADLDIAVLSSLNEGLPVTVIEAMAAARPIVATRVGGVSELLDDGKSGIIVPPSNSEELAGGIMRILGDEHLAKSMSESGRESAKRYRVDILVKNTAGLYEEILREKDGKCQYIE